MGSLTAAIERVIDWWLGRGETETDIAALLADELQFSLNDIPVTREELIARHQYVGEKRLVSEVIVLNSDEHAGVFFDAIDEVTLLHHNYAWLISHREGKLVSVRAVSSIVHLHETCEARGCLGRFFSKQ